MRAYQVADFSASYPVLRGTAPLVTAILAVGILGEPATASDLAGIAAIGAGTVALVLGRHLPRAALGWSLATGVAIAAYTVVDAAGVRAAPNAPSYIVWLFVTMGAVVAATFGVASRGAVFGAMRRQWRPGATAGLLSILTYGLALTAFSLGPTAPLAALRETGMITALLIAALAFDERLTPRGLAAVAAIGTGATAIILG